jgi:hypothetical protein
MDRYNSSSLLLSDRGGAAGDDDYEEEEGGYNAEQHDTTAESTEIEAGASARLSIHIDEERLEDKELPHDEDLHNTDDAQALTIEDEAVPLDCSSDKAVTVPETPLPLGKMIPIMLLTLSESFNSSAIFSYVGYLVLDFNLTDDKKELGCVTLSLTKTYTYILNII